MEMCFVKVNITLELLKKLRIKRLPLCCLMTNMIYNTGTLNGSICNGLRTTIMEFTKIKKHFKWQKLKTKLYTRIFNIIFFVFWIPEWKNIISVHFHCAIFNSELSMVPEGWRCSWDYNDEIDPFNHSFAEVNMSCFTPI